MVIIRPVKESDLDDLVELAGMAEFGLTSLPKDRELLEDRIAVSLRSFQFTAKKPQGELYMFVMEDLDNAKVIGTSCIVSKVGGFEPFYAFNIENTIHESERLNIRNEISFLNLVQEHSGPSEIGGLFLSPDCRKQGNGRLASLFRFLYMADRRCQFEPLIIAEMRGVVDDDGRSPFWEALGRHFFSMNYPRADYLSATDKKFISQLMPRSPIYICLLPEEAQEVIGKVHKNTIPALKMLQDEGFRYNSMVDIFDAGPMIVCRLDDIRIVKQSIIATVEHITSHPIESLVFLIANVGMEFRACMGALAMNPNGGTSIEAATAHALKLNIGDVIRFSALRPSEPIKCRNSVTS
jgi:arginine N-succinyltransferase